MQPIPALTKKRKSGKLIECEIEAKFPGYDIHMDKLSLSVSCHIGAGSKAIACIKKAEY